MDGAGRYRRWQKTAGDCRHNRDVPATPVFQIHEFHLSDVVGPLFGFNGKLLDLPAAARRFLRHVHADRLYRRHLSGRNSRAPQGVYPASVCAVLSAPHCRSDPAACRTDPSARAPAAPAESHIRRRSQIFTVGVSEKAGFRGPDRRSGRYGISCRPAYPTGRNALFAFMASPLRFIATSAVIQTWR